MVVTVALIVAAVWVSLKLHSQHALGDKVAFIGFDVTAVAAVAGIRAIPRADPDLSPDGLAKVADQLDRRLRKSEGKELERLLDRASARIDVGFTFDPAPSMNAAGAGPLGSLERVLVYYERLSPRRLAVIGGPGSGKTVLALELQLKLLRTRSTGAPVPVRFTLSRWDANHELEAWLADELFAAHSIAPPVARELVSSGMIIPVLDGLDEMDSDGQQPERAAAMVRELNDWLYGAEDMPLILTCRDEVYSRLNQYSGVAGEKGRRLLNAATVRLDSLTPTEVAQYVRERAVDPERWRAVIANLESERNSALAIALNTPWLLTLAITVYGESTGIGPARSPHELIDHTSDMHEHLLRDYVRVVTEAHASPRWRPYHPEHVERWLGELAAYLDRNLRTDKVVGGRTLSGTDVVLHELWPIAGERRPRRVDSVLAAVVSIPGLAWLGAFAFSHELYWRILLIPVLAGYIAALWRTTSTFWIAPRPVSLRQMLSSRGLAQLVIGIGCGAVVAVLFNPLAGAVVAFGAWVAGGLSLSPFQGLVTTVIPVTSPRFPLRGDVRRSLVAALSVAPSCALAFSTDLGVAVGCVCGVTYAALVGLTVAEAPWRRYIALLICTRGRLPWRLGLFLDWANDAGLLRVSGIAYQFRHRELQDWLANHH